MTDADPFTTQRETSGSVAAELAAAGFYDAEEIGSGGFGAVYRCTQAELDRVVAVKMLTADLDEDNRARFFREQRAAGRLTGHPNIVHVLHAGVTDNGRPFLVMPYYPRGSLDARIRSHGPLKPREALRLGVKLASALGTAHRAGVVHRDVKPANILFTDYDEPTLVDFGIAHLAGGFVTDTGVVTGTPAFTAPEVVAGEPPSPATDVYGLGATLFAAITGHAAFERRTGEQVVAQFLRITSEPIPDLREQGIPEDVSAIIEGAMSGDPSSRPSAAELGEQLRAAQRHHGFTVDEMVLYTPPEAEQDSTARAREKSSPIGSPAVRPSKTSGSGRAGRIPLELTSFIDRRTELTEATNALSTARLATLTGIGGVGKTRLAVRVATHARRDFADGVAYVELGELHDESLLAGVVASALGLQDRSARPLREVLAEFLAERELLLVLDNCEQLVSAVAELAEALLRTCPGLRILATSREPIGLDGEAVLPIHPLAVPDPDRLPRGIPRNDAMRLFTERAAAAVAGFELTDDNKVTIARICRQLDGLPLPIELATARLRAMSPEQVLQRLTDRFALLTRGSRSAPSRQQTLRMCIDWSYDLCTRAEQRVWAELSVFADNFELEAAQYVCGDHLAAEDLLDTVSDLVDKSILAREESGGAVRFRMLETVREYGLDKARQLGEYLEIRRRHSEWYERLALEAKADWVGPRELEWIARCHRELPNLRRALEFCVSDDPEAGIRIAAALFPFWATQGWTGEGRRWLDRLLDRRAGKVTADQAAALYAACHLAALQGDLPAVAVLVREGRQRGEQTIDPLALAHLDLTDAVLALFSGNPAQAQAYFEKAARVYVEHGDLLSQLYVETMLGLTYELCGNTEKAIRCYEHTLAITEKRGESLYRSYAMWALAFVSWRQGDSARATSLLERALRVSRAVNDHSNASMCLQALGWIAADEQDAERAVVLTAAADRIGRSVGTTPIMFADLLAQQELSESRTRRALSERTYAAAWREGAALSFEAAIAYALGERVSVTATGPAGRKLTKREREVAELIAEGLTNKEIATRLVISLRTAQGHVEHLLTKLGFTSRTQIAAWMAAPPDKAAASAPDF
ncbi:non-specific serine/threonine protein kinase [Nocardia amikacinitolerans]|uniref:protein kinase domain-containing protein n=1 Tax=Nocardia amikacinitolerans TaxID=756689 RepID=UPI0008320981|nr:protein kinase [Nocardia amikacinitolerans]MCP2321253.1 non-specific serine/threonine protein kinase [Nocardia amikacinitolerans]